MLKRVFVADIEPEFEQQVIEHDNTEVWKSPAERNGQPWLTVFSNHAPGDNPDEGYFWSQRLGTNSVAFLLYDGQKQQYCLLKQYHSPTKKFLTKAFTGSLDKAGKTETEIVVEEVREEAGYTVTEENVTKLKEFYLGHSTNEKSLLFIVDVTGIEPGEIEPENEFEQNTDMLWMSREDVWAETEDWKAVLIMQLCEDMGACEESGDEMQINPMEPEEGLPLEEV